MSTWQPFAEIPDWQPPNAEAMVEALDKMQTLSWMQRPVIVRTWVTTALTLSRGQRLGDLSADALRLSCSCSIRRCRRSSRATTSPCPARPRH